MAVASADFGGQQVHAPQWWRLPTSPGFSEIAGLKHDTLKVSLPPPIGTGGVHEPMPWIVSCAETSSVAPVLLPVGGPAPMPAGGEGGLVYESLYPFSRRFYCVQRS